MSHSEWTALALIGWAAGLASIVCCTKQLFNFMKAGGSDEIWRGIGAGRIWSVPKFPEPAATYFRKLLLGFFVAFACVVFFVTVGQFANQ